MRSFAIISLLVFFISCNTDKTNDPSPTLSPIAGDEVTDEFLMLVNNYRQDKGLRSLRSEVSMNEIAYGHSAAMAAAKVGFGHSGFSARCLEAREALGGGNLCLENVARGQKTVQEVFRTWINSSGHRQNIESNRVTHMGFGYAKDNNGILFWTHLFLER